MLKQKELKEILNFIRQGKTRDTIAKYYGISTRTLARKLKPHEKDVEIAVNDYKSVVSNIFEK